MPTDVDLLVRASPELRGDVVVGVRPEGARLWDGDGEGLLGPVAGTVAYIEALGRETFVGVDVGDARLVVHEEGRSTLVPGDEVTFGVRADGLRFFSAEDGSALTARGVAAP